jgi:hypothetical protein
MKKVSEMMVLTVGLMMVLAVFAFSEGQYLVIPGDSDPALVPASEFPQDTINEVYTPSLYYVASQEDETALELADVDAVLLPASDYPYEAVQEAYAPSLYYKASTMRTAEARD